MIVSREITDTKYGTHLVPMIAAVMATKGTVLELGMGDFSTPVLHELLKNSGRDLISLENNTDWFTNFLDLTSDFHFLLNTDYSNEVLDHRYFSAILVDNAPAEDRIRAINHFRTRCEIFIVHDWEKTKYYGYGKLSNEFKYVNVYHRYSKKTALISDTIDVTKLLNT